MLSEADTHYGRSGFIGRRAVNALSTDFAVRALVRTSAPSEWPAGVEVVRGDVTEPSVIAAAVTGCDVASRVSSDTPRFVLADALPAMIAELRGT